ncbi:MAG: hypothetical protein HDT20_02210 [Oscillibacter sp.]|nr:hypothetical protein [Oscillibacter sp.]
MSEALQQLKHRADILEAELSRLNGEPSYSTKQVREMLKEKYHCAQAQACIPGTASSKG